MGSGGFWVLGHIGFWEILGSGGYRTAPLLVWDTNLSSSTHSCIADDERRPAPGGFKESWSVTLPLESERPRMGGF